jgi:predicted AAA+ superfamily ATPase
MYQRILENIIRPQLNSGRALIVYGPRQVGKTTLAKKIAAAQGDYLYLNCDEPDVRAALTEKNTSDLRRVIGNHKFVVIDEAQRVPDIGLTLKIIIDSKLAAQVLATGSSSLDLANRVNEPLTGRKTVFNLFPLTFAELSDGLNYFERQRLLSDIVVYGSYPAVINCAGERDKQALLKELTDSALYKDVLEFQRVKNPHKIRELLRALAFQLGSEVSYSELGQQLGIDRQTVESYIDLLEQSFIIYRLPPLARNSRKEISRMKKIYFFDNGVRNALINRFERLEERPDRGELWESWAIGERIKTHRMIQDQRQHFFWRLKSGAEIDLVEDVAGDLHGIEYKYGTKAASPPESWGLIYPGASWRLVRPNTFAEQGLRDYYDGN